MQFSEGMTVSMESPVRLAYISVEAHYAREEIDNLYIMWELVLICKFFETGFFSSDYYVVCRKNFSYCSFKCKVLSTDFELKFSLWTLAPEL